MVLQLKATDDSKLWMENKSLSKTYHTIRTLDKLPDPATTTLSKQQNEGVKGISIWVVLA